MLALGLVANFSSLDLKLEMLPWTGHALTAWLIGLGIVGLIIVGLSLFGYLRWLRFVIHPQNSKFLILTIKNIRKCQTTKHIPIIAF